MRLVPMLAALCLTACGTNVAQETTASSTSTSQPAPAQTAPAISGIVYRVPSCPPAAPPLPCPPQPAPAADVDVRDGTTREGGAVVATARTGADGRYTVTVAAGRYVVAARLAGPPATNCSSVSVTVPPPATADITCAPTGAP